MSATIQIEHIISGVTLITTVIIFIITSRRQIKKEREIQDEKFAKKEEVKEKFKDMNLRIESIETVVERNRKENLYAHKEIKDDVTKHFDNRFDDLRDYIKGLFDALTLKK